MLSLCPLSVIDKDMLKCRELVQPSPADKPGQRQTGQGHELETLSSVFPDLMRHNGVEFI